MQCAAGKPDRSVAKHGGCLKTPHRERQRNPTIESKVTQYEAANAHPIVPIETATRKTTAYRGRAAVSADGSIFAIGFAARHLPKEHPQPSTRGPEMRSFHKTKLIRLLGVGAAMAAFFIAPKAADACNQYKVGFQVTVPPDNNRNFPIFYTAQSTCPNNPQPVCAPSTGITLPVNTTTTQKCTAIVADIQSRCTHLTVAADCQNTQSFTIVDANCPAGGFGHGGLFFGVSNSNEVLEPNVSAILPDYEFDTIAPDCANLLGAVSVLKGGATGVTIVMGDTSWVEAFLTLPTSTVVSFRRPTSNGDIARNVLGDLATGLNNQLGGTGINCFVDPTFHASLECSAPAGGGAITLSLHVNDTGFARLNLATPDTQTFNTLVSQAGNPDAGPLSSTTLVAPVNPVPATGSVALLGLAGLLGATGAWFVRRRRFKLEILQ